MKKKILITGATSGIGFEVAKILASAGHHLLLHGRASKRLQEVAGILSTINADLTLETFVADLSNMADLEVFGKSVLEAHDSLDVLLNNAGVFKTASPVTVDGLDKRFLVNTIAPYRLTQRFLPLMGSHSRVVNVSSAAQAPVNIEALTGNVQLSDGMEAYSQSKLAITMWSRELALKNHDSAPSYIAVNPGSMLASKMVKEGFGVDGRDIGIGSDILVRACTVDEFLQASGQYYDNDAGQFGTPHPDTLNRGKCQLVIEAIERVLARSAT